ncbi:hypothetical protein B566_EDAN004761 [Ephemera danica]|nr:hypothetical protein B566_EDAN004761 [Ephemera danica]
MSSRMWSTTLNTTKPSGSAGAGDTEMAVMSPLVQPLAIFTGYISMLQAVAWGVIDILAIIGWAECENWDDNSIFLSSLQEIYYKDHEKCAISIRVYDWFGFIMTPYDVLAWMIIMLCFNSIWFVASVAFVAGWDRRLVRHSKWVTIVWCLVTSAVCIVDLIACAMFGADYGTIYRMHPVTDPTFVAPSAVIMTLAIRGFTLWFFNVGMNIRRISRGETTPMDLYGPPAPGHDAYNEGFVHEQNQRHQPSQISRGPRATEQLTAGYPRTAPGQHIPRPDYSPPETRHHASRHSSSRHSQEPQLRSALKNSESFILSMYGEY